MFGGSTDEPFAPIRADDAYYFFQFMSSLLYRVPLDESDATEVVLSNDAQQALQWADRISIKNYDADWLYLTVDNNSISRIRKDGSEYQLLADESADTTKPIDVVDGRVFYTGTDGLLYMGNEPVQ